MELNNFFIAVYTNECKDYCDEKFFKRLHEIKGKNYLGIVDNSKKEKYVKRLRTLAPTAAIQHIQLERSPKNSLFQRNVTESVNLLRENFLKLNKDYFLIIESDVLPPIDLLEKFNKSIEYLNYIKPGTVKTEDRSIYIGPWGAIGAVYYRGFHKDLQGLKQTDHVLSGCTLYKRELIEKYPFRYDPESLRQFPDFWISYDSRNEYSLWDDHDIQCEHLHTEHGLRMSKGI